MSKYENDTKRRESRESYEGRRQALQRQHYEEQQRMKALEQPQYSDPRYSQGQSPQNRQGQADPRYSDPRYSQGQNPQNRQGQNPQHRQGAAQPGGPSGPSYRGPVRYPGEPDPPKKKKKGGIGGVITTILLVLAIGVFCFAAYKLIGYYMDYKAGSDEYDRLAEDFVTIQPEKETSASNTAEQAADTQVLRDVEDLEDPSTKQSKVDAAKKEAAMENGEEKQLPTLINPINFRELNAINTDIIGWIRLGALDISYPVAQSTDNESYLHRTFERKDNFAGCIFLNCDNSKYFTDQNSIIYGHNMKNGSMFGTLKDLKEQATYDSNPYFWIFTPDLIYQYRIFSCSLVGSVGDPYRVRFTTDEFASFLNTMCEGSLIDNHGLDVTSDDRIVTLSTCTGNDATRFIVQGRLEQVYKSIEKAG